MINDCRTLGVYNKRLKKVQILKEITDKPEKVLMQARCKICGVPGMAYQDPNERQPKDHFCIRHNPDIHKKKVLPDYLGSIVCKECKQTFNNNGRNAQGKKEFCSSWCCSKYWSRVKREEGKA